MNNEKIKSLARWLAIIVFGVLSLGSIVRANVEFDWKSLEDKIAGLVAEQLLSTLPESLGEVLGASGTRFPNGISATNVSPVAGEVRGTTLTFSATSTFGNSMVKGSALTTSTEGKALTLSEGHLLYYNFLSVTPNGSVADLVYTLPASSTLTTLIPSPGDSKSLFIRNTTGTLGTDIELNGGAGTYLEFASSSIIGTHVITASTTGQLTCLRQVNTDVSCLLSTFNQD